MDTSKKKSKCLHIGCGLVAPEGWENIDASPSLLISKIPVIGHLLVKKIGGPDWPKSVHYGNLVKGLAVQPESYELIFAAHVLEHLSLPDFKIAVEKVYSYLMPGGIFRAIVPDLEQYINSYINHRENQLLSAHAASEFMAASLVGCHKQRTTIYQRLREAFSNSRHQWMWDQASLTEAFSQQGFKDIRQCEYGEWSDPRFGDVETEENHLNAICIEGVK